MMRAENNFCQFSDSWPFKSSAHLSCCVAELCSGNSSARRSHDHFRKVIDQAGEGEDLHEITKNFRRLFVNFVTYMSVFRVLLNLINRFCLSKTSSNTNTIWAS